MPPELSFRSLLLDFDLDSPLELESPLRWSLEECDELEGLPTERDDTVLISDEEDRLMVEGEGRELLGFE